MYREPTNTIFHQIKYAQKPWLLRVFEAELSAFARLHAHDYDVIVPVPIDPARERERGFNQAVSIAKLLARYSKKIPIRKVLQKRKRTLPQSTLDRRQRLHNLSGAFSVRSRGHIEGRHVLLVDDIVTTGSTLRECAILLKQQGASRVDFLTIARA